MVVVAVERFRFEPVDRVLVDPLVLPVLIFPPPFSIFILTLPFRKKSDDDAGGGPEYQVRRIDSMKLCSAVTIDS